MLLRDEKVEAAYFLKGDTYGGIADRKLTIPITMKVHRRRRFKFRDAQCACIAFIHDDALICGSMKVYLAGRGQFDYVK